MLPKPFPVNGFVADSLIFQQDFSIVFPKSYRTMTVYSLWINHGATVLFLRERA
ncbi:hypothetical protein SBA3_2860006 [Candidatus Sulfopaludibacter sp. SbA3]|nr:hypothetical protein SBA3_2860006 [Candidatus Sulfopaludibacter sp. SbA3]